MGRLHSSQGRLARIGEAISKKLQADGFNRIAATYAGMKESGLPLSTAAPAIKNLPSERGPITTTSKARHRAGPEADLGRSKVVVAMQGMTRDAPFHKMTPRSVEGRHRLQPDPACSTRPPIWPGQCASVSSAA